LCDRIRVAGARVLLPFIVLIFRFKRLNASVHSFCTHAYSTRSRVRVLFTSIWARVRAKEYRTSAVDGRATPRETLWYCWDTPHALTFFAFLSQVFRYRWKSREQKHHRLTLRARRVGRIAGFFFVQKAYFLIFLYDK